MMMKKNNDWREVKPFAAASSENVRKPDAPAKAHDVRIGARRFFDPFYCNVRDMILFYRLATAPDYCSILIVFIGQAINS